MTQLFDALRRVQQGLDGRGLPWAVVGGLAVPVRAGAARIVSVGAHRGRALVAALDAYLAAHGHG